MIEIDKSTKQLFDFAKMRIPSLNLKINGIKTELKIGDKVLISSEGRNSNQIFAHYLSGLITGWDIKTLSSPI